MKESRLQIRIRMVNSKLRAYGLDEGLTSNDDLPSIDSKFSGALINYTNAVTVSILRAQDLLTIALERNFTELAHNLEEDLTRLEKLRDELNSTQVSLADMEISCISITADAIHSAKLKSKL